MGFEAHSVLTVTVIKKDIRKRRLDYVLVVGEPQTRERRGAGSLTYLVHVVKHSEAQNFRRR